jgi:hypothetical protein
MHTSHNRSARLLGDIVVRMYRASPSGQRAHDAFKSSWEDILGRYWLIAVAPAAATTPAATISAVAATASASAASAFGLGSRFIDVDCASTD